MLCTGLRYLIVGLEIKRWPRGILKTDTRRARSLPSRFQGKTAAQFMRKQRQPSCSLILPTITCASTFPIEICSFPQEGDKQGAEKSDSYHRGPLEMGRERDLVRNLGDTGVLVRGALALSRGRRS